MEKILVQMANEQWTLAALHRACQMAQKSWAEVTLLHLMQLRHPRFVGAVFHLQSPTEEENQRIQLYKQIAISYGLELTLQRVPCYSFLDSISQAADLENAQIVFAHVPHSWIPYWQKFETWCLENRLKAHKRELHTLEPTLSLNQPLSEIRKKKAVHAN